MKKIKFTRKIFSKDIITEYPNTVFIKDYKSAFIGISESNQSVYNSFLLYDILYQNHVPNGFEPKTVTHSEICHNCFEEIDFLDQLWKENYGDRSPIISRDYIFHRDKLKKTREGKWYEINL
ncbi:MAG: hypothetical protein ACN6OJ_18785 [Chryseobacterium sp.]|uniref:hypothetical protein n=1 Tax=Chryseobacterium sp. TaxID=1871047 RepID=UPI003D0BC15A